MKNVCSFFGHSMFVECRIDLKKFKTTIETLIKKGVHTFLVGNHGEFDKLALQTCLELKDKYSHIKIIKVLSNISSFSKEKLHNKNIEIITYPIEQYHFKQRILKTNQFMIDNSDVIVAFVDMREIKSGAKQAILYALRKNKQIINLFEP